MLVTRTLLELAWFGPVKVWRGCGNRPFLQFIKSNGLDPCVEAGLLIADGQSYAGGCSGGRSQALARQPLRQLGICTRIQPLAITCNLSNVTFNLRKCFVSPNANANQWRHDLFSGSQSCNPCGGQRLALVLVKRNDSRFCWQLKMSYILCLDQTVRQSHYIHSLPWPGLSIKEYAIWKNTSSLLPQIGHLNLQADFFHPPEKFLVQKR